MSELRPPISLLWPNPCFTVAHAKGMGCEWQRAEWLTEQPWWDLMATWSWLLTFLSADVPVGEKLPDRALSAPWFSWRWAMRKQWCRERDRLSDSLEEQGHGISLSRSGITHCLSWTLTSFNTGLHLFCVFQGELLWFPLCWRARQKRHAEIPRGGCW